MSRPLKVGVQLPEVEYAARWPEQKAMVQTAERIGLDSVWVGDHLLYRWPDQPPRGPWEAWTSLAAIAAVTDRIQLGPLVASTSFHNPAMLAKKAATIEEISRGRLILGLGAGWNQVEYDAFGFPFDHRVSRFEEAFTIIRSLLRSGRCDLDGRYYQVRDCELLPRGPRPEGPPLMIGSEGERMLAITLPHVQAWNAWFAWFGNTPDGYRPMRDKIDAACRAAGRDPSEIERTVAVYVAMPDGRGRFTGNPNPPQVDPVSSEPEVLANALHAFAEEGVGHVQLVLDPINADSIAALAPTLARLDA
ncbi:MAG TPA: LLM class flavin-dependent oxidoreductase [Candidatus Limnocylindria bacterium]|jgi:alkanesulfonate monooxygenase SsuD/methylene tetrahydromethanopterin reductase-like flavin-dependent oxidoreductase (luciferase family)